MPNRQNPAVLNGDKLARWYRQPSGEIEKSRKSAADQRHAEFFGRQIARPERDQTADNADGTLWIATGSGGYRAVHPGGSQPYFAPQIPENLPSNPAEPEISQVLEIGNPHNPRLRKEWEIAHGRPWPRTADGLNFHVAHKRAIADGGSNTLDNIEPMHPDEHIAQHKNNGDQARWGRRPWTARAFGGRVVPPKPAIAPRGVRMPSVRMNGLGLLGIIPTITGLLSGRIRTDTPMHFWSDMAGVPDPSEEDVVGANRLEV